jgi:hypothetical protein
MAQRSLLRCSLSGPNEDADTLREYGTPGACDSVNAILNLRVRTLLNPRRDRSGRSLTPMGSPMSSCEIGQVRRLENPRYLLQVLDE